MAISAELGENLEKVVSDLVENGRYNSKSEVLREGVRLVQEREAHLRELEAKIQAGVDDFEAGRSSTIDQAFQRVRKQIAAGATQKAS
ncbi:type II toxin-antitoxin system ParD family antitoxin [Devosia lacusdianchii]|uniref:type II toxin-antitoxin system ParD family antitoxin n=1 Tax=Devosia lacusdianchii TaxID=2917991 RepID=UPI001F0612DC|nr:type II toxin-antitoxin system ParD family antitoxin [Devosia sp. JXJ CY 41]